MRTPFMGLMWPEYWIANDNHQKRLQVEDMKLGLNEMQSLVLRTALPYEIIDVEPIIGQDCLHHISILFTFGICSPFLATLISTCVIIKLHIWVVVIGRYMSLRSDLPENMIIFTKIKKILRGVFMNTIS
jgi:hypothetical protein